MPLEISTFLRRNHVILGRLSGNYPQRLRYGSDAQSNPNYSQAVSEQDEVVQGTKLWFAQ